MHLSSPDVGLLPTFAIIGAGIPVAVGVGLAAQVHGTDDVGIAVFGDGTTNIGAFHEGLNLASVWKVPCVFVIENNLYGEYSPQRLTTPIDDLADRAASYAIPGEVIDGQDVDAVIDAMNRSLERARAGEGPTLLEMKTYRYAGHSRSDQGLYRPEGELEEWKLRDPIRLLADGLVADGVLTDTALEELETSYSEVIDQITAEVLDAPMPPREEILANVWA
jgi:pyruvate dehydrogenase E1 component alpha subunit